MAEAEMSGIPVHNLVLNSMSNTCNSLNKKEVFGPIIDEGGLSAIVIDLLQFGMNKECKDNSLHRPANCK